MFSAYFFVYEGLVYYFLALGPINILCKSGECKPISVSVVILTEKLQSHRATVQSRSITLLTQKLILLQKLSVAFI